MVQVYADRGQDKPAETTFREGEYIPIVAYFTTPDGKILVSSGAAGDICTAISVSVFDLNGDLSAPIYGPTALTTTAVLFTALQTDTYWTMNTTGYSFRHSLTPAMIVPQAGRTYRIEYLFTTTNYDVVPLKVDATCEGMLSVG